MSEHSELQVLADGLSSLLGVPVGVHGDLKKRSDVVSTLAGGKKSGEKISLLTSPDPDLLAWRDAGDAEAGVRLAELAVAAKKAGQVVAWRGYTLGDDEHLERHIGVVAAASNAALAKQVTAALEAGMGSFPIALAATGSTSDKSKSTAEKVRICIVTNEIFGPSRNGGIGTAYTALAELLAREPSGAFEVTVLFNNDQETEEPIAHWVEFYREKGIALVPIPQERPPELRWQDDYMWRAWSAARWLRENDALDEGGFDIVHFPECNGQGYYALQAKRCGLAFAATTFCIGTHSSTRWIYQSGGDRFNSTYLLQLDFMEQRSVELADLVVSPSHYLIHWMRGEGWKLPNAVAQQNIQPFTTRLADAAAESPLPLVTGIRELVFFGRIESRKGIHTFCDALDLLNEDPAFRDAVTVTFMGKQVSIDGGTSADLLEKRSAEWGFDWQILDDKNQDEAVTYLQGEGRLALMPSPVDNSPYTVLECIGLKIPFITTRAGGIPELIHPEDLPSATFYHRDREKRAPILAQKITTALSDGIRPPRRAVSAAATEAAWIAWHQTGGDVPVAAVNTAPVKGEVIDLPQDETTELSALLDSSTASDDNAYLILLDPCAQLVKGAKETLLSAAALTGADILTAFDDSSTTAPSRMEAERHYFPLGQHPAIPLFWNCYGRGVWCIKIGVLRDLLASCSQRETCSLAGLRDGRLLTHATLLGKSLELVPEVLSRLDTEVIAKDKDGCDYPIDPPSVSTYLAHMPPAADTLVNFALGQREEAEKMNDELWHLRWKTGDLQEQVDDRLTKFQAAKDEVKREKSARKEAESSAKKHRKERDLLQAKLDRRFFVRLKRLFGG